MSAELRLLREGADPATDDVLAALYSVADRSVLWMRANFVASIDGAATHNGLSAGLGSPADRRVFDLLRRLADVIVVGAGTVRAEGYGPMRLDDAQVAWRVQHGLAPHPVFAIVSSSLELDPASTVFTNAPSTPLVFTGSRAPGERRATLAEVAEVIDCGEFRVDTRLMRRALAERGLMQLHSEGGPQLLGTMIEEGTIDELCLTLSARLEGGTASRITDGGGAVPTDMRLAHACAAADGTLLLRYLRA